MKYRQEFLAGVRGEIEALVQDHYDEVHPAGKVFDWNMDWDSYEKIEEHGLLRIFTARQDSELAGYLCVLITPNLHSKGSAVACDDGFFVAKSHRGKPIAKNLIRFAETCLKEDGLKVFYIVGTTEKPIDALMLRMGYTAIETKFQKVL